jgi:protein-S-isoprenylcysteine O-methyltransferase Ste14
MIAHLLPLVGLALFFVIGFIWRPWLQYRRYGTLGVVLFHSTRWDQWLRDSLVVTLLLAAFAQAIGAAMWPNLIRDLSIFTPPARGLGLAIGAALMFGGTALMVIAQLRLGASWRIGIEETASPGLVTGGLYQVCRNPIFLGMFSTMTGLALLLPTFISAAVFLGTVVCTRSQTLEEEAYLLATYGEAYRRYAQRVGRFLPGLGTLA